MGKHGTSKLRGNVCGLCGKELLRGRWFIGGPMAALAPLGAYLDPPLHYECMVRGLKSGLSPVTGVVGLTDTHLIPEPTPKLLVAVMAVGQFYTDRGYVVPKKPFRAMEFWRNGVLERRFERDVIAAAMHEAAVVLKTAGML